MIRGGGNGNGSISDIVGGVKVQRSHWSDNRVDKHVYPNGDGTQQLPVDLVFSRESIPMVYLSHLIWI